MTNAEKAPDSTDAVTETIIGHPFWLCRETLDNGHGIYTNKVNVDEVLKLLLPNDLLPTSLIDVACPVFISMLQRIFTVMVLSTNYE